MSAFLETMSSRSRNRAEETRRRVSMFELRESLRSGPPSRSLDSFGETFDVIAEVKPRSPSEGAFPERSPADVAALGYEAGGAGMISVLTEPSEFGGSIENLRAVAAAVSIPVLAKDFLVDPIQVYEARAAGADGVLLIARIVDDDAMSELLDAAAECGLFALLEAFDEVDLGRISEVPRGRGDMLVGVNCRDLDTLDIVPGRHEALAGHLPPDLVTVAESAMLGSPDIERVASLGYRAALVGSALMRSNDPDALVREMVDAGRRVSVAT